MTNLMAAHAQWSTRPADERFKDLDVLGEFVDARRTDSLDTDLRLGTITLDHDRDGELYATAGDNRMTFSNWSFGQFSRMLGAPPSYLRTLPGALAQVNLEYHLECRESGTQKSKLMYQAPNGHPGVAQAFTSTTYGRIWDIQVVRAVQHMNDDGRWTVPLKAYGGVNSEQATTLYASDRDVFIFLVDEARPIEVDGQTYYRGFYTWNSEVGKSSFGLSTFLFSRVCANRIIWNVMQVKELRIRHTSLAPDRFFEQAAPALRALSEASAQPIEQAIRTAKATKVGRTVEDVEQWLVRKGFGKSEAASALNIAVRGGESGTSGDPTNAWDAVNALTAYARGIKHTDTRLAFEQKAGALLAADGTAVR